MKKIAPKKNSEMTQSNEEIDQKIINYIDASSKNDEDLLLIANLLTQSGQPLDAIDGRRVGDLIRDYMNKKILLDHYFWHRSLKLCCYPNDELKMRITLLKQRVFL